MWGSSTIKKSLEESWVLLKGYPYPKGRLSTTTSSKRSVLFPETYPHCPAPIIYVSCAHS
ncbi:hypothetical protein HMPREF1556_01267 [Porphyromonas sp. oral taxon 278 str. W7784]|nr:hypothetical protein HMPREF1556_01267 [Porphyromonas sp. oral taxon 278 str. W7784]